jgi:hypothetical protein
MRMVMPDPRRHETNGVAGCTEFKPRALLSVAFCGKGSSSKLGHLFCVVVLRTPHKSRTKQMNHGGWVGDTARCTHMS